VAGVGRGERELAAEHGERAGVAGEQVVAQYVPETQAAVEAPRPSGRARAVLGGRQEHVPAIRTRQQGPQQVSSK
jgi:hypothetical protein